MSSGIEVMQVKDLNEHSFMVKVVYPMWDALSAKLVSNIQAVEPFWEEKYGTSNLSKKTQDRILVTRYIQKLKLLMPTFELTEYEIRGVRDFGGFTDTILALIRDSGSVQDLLDGIYGECSFGGQDEESPAAWLSPFTLLKPHLTGSYNQEADFLEASEVLTIQQPIQHHTNWGNLRNDPKFPQNNPMFGISQSYWEGVNWNLLLPTVAADLTLDLPSRSRKNFQMIKAGIEVGDEKNKIDPLYYINVYKLVRFTDADDDVELESKDILFRLGMVALPSEEGYRLAPATFAMQLPKLDERERTLQLDYFLNTLKDSRHTIEITNHYSAQGLFNWMNL
jgi:hypothetical protein